MPKTTRRKEPAAKANSSAPIDTLVVISDLHCGSTMALMPPGFVTLEGQKVEQSAAQAWLWKAWCLFLADISDAVRGHRWALVLNGDLVEGIHHRSVQVISADMSDHVACALQVLEPLAAQADAVLVVAGTECHTHSTEEAIARRLGAKVAPCGRHAPHRWEFEVQGCHVVARHHINATTRRGLEATQLSIHLAEEQVNAAAAGRSIPRVLLAAHRHTSGTYRKPGHGLACVTPPWQLLTRFGHKVVPAAASALQVGGVAMRFPGDGQLPFVQEFVYDAEHAAPVKL